VRCERVFRELWTKGLAKDSYFDRDGGNTPITYAAGEGHLSCIQFLLKNNADVNSRNKYALAVNVVCCDGCGFVHEVVVFVLCEDLFWVCRTVCAFEECIVSSCCICCILIARCGFTSDVVQFRVLCFFVVPWLIRVW
jgi:hypothetical protein